jgi:hypothetical protein
MRHTHMSHRYVSYKETYLYRRYGGTYHLRVPTCTPGDTIPISHGLKYDYWFANQEDATKLLVVQFQLFNDHMQRLQAGIGHEVCSSDEQPVAGSSDFAFKVQPRAGTSLLCEARVRKGDAPSTAFDGDDAKSEAASLHDWFLARVEPGALSLNSSSSDLAHLEAYNSHQATYVEPQAPVQHNPKCQWPFWLRQPGQRRRRKRCHGNPCPVHYA